MAAYSTSPTQASGNGIGGSEAQHGSGAESPQERFPTAKVMLFGDLGTGGSTPGGAKEPEYAARDTHAPAAEAAVAPATAAPLEPGQPRSSPQRQQDRRAGVQQGLAAPEEGGEQNSDPNVGAQAPVHQETEGAAGESGLEDDSEAPSKGFYFVRVPRQEVDYSATAALKTKLRERNSLLKELNQQLQPVRNEVNILSQQLRDAYALQNESNPEFLEKKSKLNEMKDIRSAYVQQIVSIKSSLHDLDCKTEEELNRKIQGIEYSISHDALPLAEEKRLVREIARLNGQRDQLRVCEAQASSLKELQDQSFKLQGMIMEMEGDFRGIKGEHEQTNSIIAELKKKRTAEREKLDKLDKERSEHEELKRKMQEELNTLQAAVSAEQQEYVENRRFGQDVRDLVRLDRLEEAQALVARQVEDYMTKLNSDAAYRREYCQMWSKERRTAVSVLLPDSGLQSMDAERKRGWDEREETTRLMAGSAERSAAKAQAIIAAALQSASVEVQERQKKMDMSQAQQEPVNSEEFRPPAPVEVTAFDPKRQTPVKKPAGASTASNSTKSQSKTTNPFAKYAMPLPHAEYDEFIPPPPAQHSQPKLSEEELKEKVREEQRQKAAEAEARKRRRLAAKKRHEAHKTAAEAGAEDRDKAALTAAPAKPLAEDRAEVAEEQEKDASLAAKDGQNAAAADAHKKGAVELGSSSRPSVKAGLTKREARPPKSSLKMAMAKRPKAEKNVLRNIWKTYPVHISVASFVALLLGIFAIMIWS